jgi:hypothetical protein
MSDVNLEEFKTSTEPGKGMKADKRHPWIELLDHGGIPYIFCHRCGRSTVIDMPCAINVFAAVVRAVVKEHHACKEYPPSAGDAKRAKSRAEAVREICLTIGRYRDGR